jgi:factor associated with neutral sphingomyelinase activation
MDKQVVSDVHLPEWARKNPYLFVVTLREAFESNYVSQNLNKWIDFIFGYKQQGVEAEKAINTYSVVTYEDKVDLDALG